MLCPVTFFAYLLVGLVAALHLVFMALEMLWWTSPTGQQVFGTDPEFAEKSKVLAANQGLYNGFLAAGLIWGAVTEAEDVMAFFLVCVIIAGLYGGATVNRRILLWQALPAALALVVGLLAFGS